MGFWIFMLLMVLLIPGILISFGGVFRKNVPVSANALFGYRTAMSMKIRDTWEFANRLFGKLAYRVGMCMVVLSAIAMVPFLWHSEDTVGMVGTVIMTVQLIPIIGIIPVVERALKKEFDKDGNRRT